MDILLSDEQLRSGVLTAGLLAAVWAIAAFAQPSSTYHLAPILIAGAVPILSRRHGARFRRFMLAALAGSLMASTAAVALSAFDLLRGPSLLPYGGALAEALTFASVGAAIGALLAVVLAAQLSRNRG
ncbi:MAG: hypothetical protein QNL12_02275 [Acidimicrobiia bacterium]|nr:hypothetical protein [Acidimicrobiia bacterium]MDX2466113.1 hypothetical protein [Acidimicrobiia bacterium]